MAAEGRHTKVAGSLVQCASSKFAWTIVGVLDDRQAFYLESPRFSYCRHEFSFKLSTRLQPGFFSVYLRAHKGRQGWPDMTFSLCMSCSNRAVPQLPLSKEVSHKYSQEEEDWGFTQFREIRDCASEDTYVFTVHIQQITSASAAEGALLGLGDSLLLSVAGQPSALAQFYGNAELSDCTVCTDDGRTFPSHKLALCSASPVIKAMFTTSIAMQDASSSTVTMRDADPAVVELLLQYMYGNPELRVPVAAIVAFYKLADQYQVAAAKGSLMQALSNTSFSAEAVSRLLPQSLSLGSAAPLLTDCLATEAVECYQELMQQQDFVEKWQVQDVKELIQMIAACDSTCPSRAFKCIQVAAAWALLPLMIDLTEMADATGPAGTSQAVTQGHQQQAADTPQGMMADDRVQDIRLQQWPEIQSSMLLDDLTIGEAKVLQSDPRRPLERLPGLAAAVLAVVLEKA